MLRPPRSLTTLLPPHANLVNSMATPQPSNTWSTLKSYNIFTYTMVPTHECYVHPEVLQYFYLYHGPDPWSCQLSMRKLSREAIQVRSVIFQIPIGIQFVLQTSRSSSNKNRQRGPNPSLSLSLVMNPKCVTTNTLCSRIR